MDVTIVGNFSLTTNNVQPNFSKTGSWFDYFSGESITVSDPIAPIPLTPGEFHIYTTVKQPTPKAGLVTAVEDEETNPLVLVYPNPTHGKVYLSLGTEVHGTVHLSFRDILGRSIDLQSVLYQGQPLELDVTKFEQGIYFIHAQSNTNKNIILKLLIED